MQGGVIRQVLDGLHPDIFYRFQTLLLSVCARHDANEKGTAVLQKALNLLR